MPFTKGFTALKSTTFTTMEKAPKGAITKPNRPVSSITITSNAASTTFKHS